MPAGGSLIAALQSKEAMAKQWIISHGQIFSVNENLVVFFWVNSNNDESFGNVETEIGN